MIRICCKCKKILGEKAPFEDKRETHTYCDECFLSVKKQLLNLEEQKTLDITTNYIIHE
jgi:hypothetical protein